MISCNTNNQRRGGRRRRRAGAECFAIREGDGEQDIVMVTQVREDEEKLDDFRKDRGDEDVDCGIITPLTDAECRRIATVSVKDEELEDLTPTAVISEFKDGGAPPLWEEMTLVVVREPGAALVLIGIEVRDFASVAKEDEAVATVLVGVKGREEHNTQKKKEAKKKRKEYDRCNNKKRKILSVQQ